MNRNSQSSFTRNIIATSSFVLVAAVSGCNKSVPYVDETAVAPISRESIAVQMDRDGRDADAYRIRADVQRGRYWVLAQDQVRIYRASDKRLIQTVVLPEWNVAGFIPVPDMVLDRSGAALISSNIVPMLWRIDAHTFRVTRIDITLQTKENWDVGFASLALAADGTLFGVTAMAASLWSIKPEEGKATPIDLTASAPIAGARALRVAYYANPGASSVQQSLCMASASGPRRIELSSDSTSGRVYEQSCDVD